MKEDRLGRLAETIFHNEQNFYTVAVFESADEQFFAVGTLPYPKPGRDYRLTGEWKTHPKYGEQFSFTSFEEMEPRGEEGILAFLASGSIKGIGPSAAEKIVKRFGEKSLEIIQNEPERLTEISGIGKVKAKAIHEGYVSQREFADVVLGLAAYDISAATAMKLYRVYGAESVSVIEENPYKIIDDMYGVGFKKADAIAKKLGHSDDDPHRIKSAVIFMLNQSAGEGNTFEYRTELIEKTALLLDISREKVEELLLELIMDNKIYADTVEDVPVIMLYRYYKAEHKVAQSIYTLCHASLPHINADYDNIIAQAEKDSGMEFSDKQKLAIVSSIKNGVSVITGGPGTGKTTIIHTILKILTAANVKTALCAPTGRAAKRMEETCKRPASTIHRLLEYYFSEESEGMRFGKNEESPLDHDCIIVDEVSMVDILLMEGLLRAIKPGTRLIMVGDADQLPPVGAGSVLKDILSTELVHAVRLTEPFRQAQESMIVVNAHRINKGEYPCCNEKDKDFFLLDRKKEPEIAETIKDLCVRRLPAFIGKENCTDMIQVLTPTRKGPLGSVELNKALQAALNPPAPEKSEKQVGDRIYRVGDRVMQNKNNYQLGWRSMRSFDENEGVFNGDLGIIQSVDNDAGTVSVLYDGDRLATYDYSNLDELETAFAMTVHKSQGSEFPVVVMPMARFPKVLATRNLLYTAVTRARETVVLVGIPEICNAMTDNISVVRRNSGLAYQLQRVWDFDAFENF